MIDEGKAYTPGNSFRARAEAQQRRYRALVLKVEHGDHAHWLRPEDADRGLNFVGNAFCEAKARDDKGKGVGKERTFSNMLSSQAMCFNIFGNLRSKGKEGCDIAAKALARSIPAIRAIEDICLEFTPPKELFKDQSGQAGVDCDVLIRYSTDTGRGVSGNRDEVR